jgi:hypothetical protein
MPQQQARQPSPGPVVSGGAAQAAERWPANVCAEIAQGEKLARENLGKYPRELAFARQSELVLLQKHCGVDVTAKFAEDDKAIAAAAAAMPSSGPLPETRRHKSPSRDPMFCNTVKIDGDLSSTVCN